MKPTDQLLILSQLYEQKNKQYGDSYKESGAVLGALFPKGIHLETHIDFNRFCILVHIITKLSRYCNNFDDPIYDDHLKDISVYATMLLELDGLKG